jgi:uncharacterized protein
MLWQCPGDAVAALVLAHGAGAGMRHAFIEGLAGRLATHGTATLRYQFPFMEAGSRRPDAPAVLTATVRAALAVARERAEGLPLFAGGKSMGGRMTTTAASEAALEDMRGIVLFGFPLHYAGTPAVTRAAHLARVECPMLFLQGTRDALADLDLMKQVTAPLPRATLHVVDGADHAFTVLKRSGRDDDDVLEELARTVDAWCEAVR